MDATGTRDMVCQSWSRDFLLAKLLRFEDKKEMDGIGTSEITS